MSKHTNGYARLLESWTAPPEAGAPIGFIATSFTFSSDFFEEECLSRFLKLESDPDEDGAIYLIEQVEKLASLSSATVLVDQCHAKVRRNLRWDLIPVRLSKGIMHAKISVLFWSNHIRVIIGSTNLTPDGYRRNQEIFSVLEAFPGSETPAASIKSIFDYLQAAINSEPYINSEIKKRPLELIAQIRGRMRLWKLAESNDSKNNIHVYPLLIRPGGKDLFSQMHELWNRYSTSPVQTVYICSPFYDDPQSENKPAKKVWEILNKRAACVNYYCTGEQVEGEEKLFLHAPETLQKHAFTHSSPEVNFYRLPEKKEANSEYRPVHLKSYWLEAKNGWTLYVIGSSNFTTNGTGLREKGNYEANIAFVYNAERNRQIYKAVREAWLEGEHIDINDIHWKPVAPEDQKEAAYSVLAPFFKSAELVKEEDKLCIRFHFDPGQAPGQFSIQTESGTEVYSSLRWFKDGSPEIISLPWADPALPFGFNVFVNEGAAPAWLSLNVQDHFVLPPPEELRNLPLDILAQVLTSALPLHKVLAKALKHRSKSKGNQSDVDLDPHKRVDVSQFILQRTRRYSVAINNIRKRLEAPLFSYESLHWRIYGPVGLEALVNAFIKESASKEETVFFISEIILELGNVQPQIAEGCLEPAIVKEALLIYIKKLEKTMIREVSGGVIEVISSYAQKSFKRSKKLLTAI